MTDFFMQAGASLTDFSLVSCKRYATIIIIKKCTVSLIFLCKRELLLLIFPYV